MKLKDIEKIEDVRLCLEKHLKKKVDDDIWRDLSDGEGGGSLPLLIKEMATDGELEEDIAGEFKRLVQLYRKFEKRGGAVKATIRERREKIQNNNTELTSAFFAVEARALPEVNLFRRKYLPNGLLQHSQIETWLKNQQAEEGVFSIKKISEGGTKGWMVGLEQPALGYGVPNSNHARYIPISPFGVLNQLKSVAKTLSHSFGWHEENAVIFILTGQTQLTGNHITYPEPHSCNYKPRVKMEVFIDTPPDKVLEAFYWARKAAGFTRERIHPVTPRLTALAHFVLDNEKKSWQERWEEWNRTQKKEWRYKNRSVMLDAYNSLKKKILYG